MNPTPFHTKTAPPQTSFLGETSETPAKCKPHTNRTSRSAKESTRLASWSAQKLISSLDFPRASANKPFAVSRHSACLSASQFSMSDQMSSHRWGSGRAGGRESEGGNARSELRTVVGGGRSEHGRCGRLVFGPTVPPLGPTSLDLDPCPQELPSQ